MANTDPITAAEHPNVELARRGYDAFARSDLEALLEFFASDIVWHVGGDGPLGGAHDGIEAVAGLFGQIFELTGGTQRLELLDVFASDDQIVAVLRETATRARDGVELEVREAHVLRLDADNKVTEVWDLPDDPAAHDAFFR